MVKKLNWLVLLITVGVCARHLIGLGYFIERDVSYRIKGARREVEFKAQQDDLRQAIDDLNGHLERIKSLSLFFPNPNLLGIQQLGNELSWWLNSRLSSETTDLPGQGRRTMTEYFAGWAEQYQIPVLSVMSPDQEKYSAYACYVCIPVSLLLMLVVFTGSRVE